MQVFQCDKDDKHSSDNRPHHKIHDHKSHDHKPSPNNDATSPILVFLAVLCFISLLLNVYMYQDRT